MTRGKLSINIVSNVVYYLFSILINIWFTPYLIRHLGISAFGIVPLATTVVSYLSVLTLVLNAAVGRFITVSLEKGNIDDARGYFNTSLVASLSFVAVTLPVCTWLALHPAWFFSIPRGLESQAQLLFICTVAMFMLTVVSAPFDVATFCRNRFDIRNVLAIMASLLRVLLVVAFFKWLPAAVWQVGVGLAAASALSLGGSIWAWRRLTPELGVDLRSFSSEAFAKLRGTGSWIALNQIGTLLLLSIDLLVVNRMLGPEAGGRYASVMQWSSLLRGLGTTIAGVLAPTVIYYYARNEIDQMIAFARQAVKFLGLFLALPVGLVSGLAKPLLLVWLGPGYVSLAPLMLVMTVHLCLNLGYLPLHNIAVATNHVRVPGIVQIVIGVVNLALAIVLAGPMGWGMYGVAAAGGIVLVFRNILFTPYYGALILKRRPLIFMKELFPIIFMGAVVTLISWFAAENINLASWSRLIAYSSVFSIVYIGIVALTLNSSDRHVIARMLGLKGYGYAGCVTTE